MWFDGLSDKDIHKARVETPISPLQIKSIARRFLSDFSKNQFESDPKVISSWGLALLPNFIKDLLH
jgi:hypothetical protein